MTARRSAPRPPAAGGPALSRRGLLLAGAGLTLAAACGREDEQLSLLRMFQDGVPTGSVVRLPFAVGDEQGVPLEDPPAELPVRIGPDGGELGPPVAVARHDRGIPRAYYPLVTTAATSGVYRVVTEVRGRTLESAFTAVAPGAPDAVPGPGDPMFSTATPTVDDPRDVDPICTARPQCPLHGDDLAEALAAGRPVALLVATPAFCRTAVCGPVVDLLADQRAAYGDRVALIHAEVYTRASLEAPPTDAVRASNLRFEPCLFLVDAEGTIRQRLDNIFDVTELEAGLTAIA